MAWDCTSLAVEVLEEFTSAWYAAGDGETYARDASLSLRRERDRTEDDRGYIARLRMNPQRYQHRLDVRNEWQRTRYAARREQEPEAHAEMIARKARERAARNARKHEEEAKTCPPQTN